MILYQKKGTIPSVRHEYYVNWIQNKLNKKGFVTKLNKKEGADIVVQNPNIAIEVELGTSEVIENARNNVKQF